MMIDHRCSSKPIGYHDEFVAVIERINNISAHSKDLVVQQIGCFVQKVQLKDKSSINKTFEYVKSISYMFKDKPNIDRDVFKSILLYLECVTKDTNPNKYVDNLISLYEGKTEREKIEFTSEILRMRKINKEMNKKIKEDITKKAIHNHYYTISAALCYTFVIQIFYLSANMKINRDLETNTNIIQNGENKHFCSKIVSVIVGTENIPSNHELITTKAVEKINEIFSDVNNSKQDIKNINQNINKMNADIDWRIEYMNTEINQKIENMNTKLNQSIKDMNVKYEESINYTNEEINRNNKDTNEKIIQSIEGMNKNINESINNMYERIDKKMSDMKTEISDMKTEINEIKTEINEMKTDMNKMKTEINEMKTDMNEMKTDMNEKIDKMSGWISGIKNQIYEIASTISNNNKILLEQIASKIAYDNK